MLNRRTALISRVSLLEKPYTFSFNGKEKDNEITGNDGSELDFGARIYDARLGRWMSCDPLQAKYADLTPYQYVANSPLVFIDPNGMVLIYSCEDQATRDRVKAIIQKSVGDNYTVNIDNTGTVSIVVSDAYKKANGDAADPYSQLTPQQKIAYDEMYKVIKDPQTTTINVVSNSDVVNTGDYVLSTIDVADMEMNDNLTNNSNSPNVYSAAGKLLHETEEQYQKQTQLNNRIDKDAQMKAHNLAIDVENSYNSSKRAKEQQTPGTNQYITLGSKSKNTTSFRQGDIDWVQETVTTSDNQTVYVTEYYRVVGTGTSTIHEQLIKVVQSSSSKTLSDKQVNNDTKPK